MAGQFQVPYNATHHKVYAQDRKTSYKTTYLGHRGNVKTCYARSEGELCREKRKRNFIACVSLADHTQLMSKCKQLSHYAYMPSYKSINENIHKPTHAQVLALHTTDYHCITQYIFLDKSGHSLHQ
jgi:hypothetical protein